MDGNLYWSLVGMGRLIMKSLCYEFIQEGKHEWMKCTLLWDCSHFLIFTFSFTLYMLRTFLLQSKDKNSLLDFQCERFVGRRTTNTSLKNLLAQLGFITLVILFK